MRMTCLIKHVGHSEEDYAGAIIFEGKEQLGEIQILREHDGFIFLGPFENRIVGRRFRADITPVGGGPAGGLEMPRPFGAEVHVDDQLHAGCVIGADGFGFRFREGRFEKIPQLGTVRIENDANCFAVSEAVDGAGRGSPVVFGVILGTGVGAGIGLSLEKSFVELHGGDVKIESESDEGPAIVGRLPRRAQTPAPEGNAA